MDETEITLFKKTLGLNARSIQIWVSYVLARCDNNKWNELSSYYVF